MQDDGVPTKEGRTESTAKNGKADISTLGPGTTNKNKNKSLHQTLAIPGVEQNKSQQHLRARDQKRGQEKKI